MTPNFDSKQNEQSKLIFSVLHVFQIIWLFLSILERLIFVLGLVLHCHFPALTHSESECSLDVLRISKLVHVLSEHLSQV